MGAPCRWASPRPRGQAALAGASPDVTFSPIAFEIGREIQRRRCPEQAMNHDFFTFARESPVTLSAVEATGPHLPPCTRVESWFGWGQCCDIVSVKKRGNGSQDQSSQPLALQGDWSCHRFDVGATQRQARVPKA